MAGWTVKAPLVALLVAALPGGLAAQNSRVSEETRDVLRQLVEAYGPAGREGPVAEVVRRLLPAWAQPQTDSAGNVWVRAGSGGSPVVFVAHMDEIGFAITGIRPDGQLTIRPLGGFFPSLFEAEPALVHTAAARAPIPGVFTLRDSVGNAPRRTPASTPGQTGGQTQIAFRVDVGTADADQTRALGIAVGDVVTMPKQFVPLAGTRATGRSFDDRVGVAAQILALRQLNRSAVRRELIFIFSVREETGLTGARIAANELGTAPARVHALDTFVSADAPLEPRNFADAPIGRGAVARAVDNSSVTPPALLDSLVSLARSRGIALQVGTTNGGNDGSVFTRFGVPDVPIGWPLRYSHSPAEVIDLKDLVAMADLVRAIAERW